MTRLLAWALGSAVTVAAYVIAARIHVAARRHPLVNAVVIAAALLIALLVASGTSYAAYADASRPIALLLGPATVALALPLYRSLATLKTAVRPVTVGLFVGAGTASASAMGVAWALGASRVTVRSLAPKSVTTPIAMAVAARTGGNASLTAVFVIVTGMIGAVAVPGIFRLVGVVDARARGLAIGVAAHGLGTARALGLGATEAAFAALGMGLSGIVTPIVLPAVLAFFG